MRVINGDPVPSDSTSTAISPQEQALMDMLVDPLRNPMMTGRVENTFGPFDYIAGSFPIGRVLAPYAARVMNALGLGEDAGVNLAKEAFSRRFGQKARMGDRAFNKELYKTASPYEARYGGPYSGMDIPTTQDVLGLKVAPPPRTIKMPSSTKVEGQKLRFGQEMKELDQVKNLVDNPQEFRRAYDYMGNYPDYDGGYYVDEAADAITRKAGQELGLLDAAGKPTKKFDDIFEAEDIANEIVFKIQKGEVTNAERAFRAGDLARERGVSPEVQRMAIDEIMRRNVPDRTYRAATKKPPRKPLDQKKIDEMDDLLRQMLGDE